MWSTRTLRHAAATSEESPPLVRASGSSAAAWQQRELFAAGSGLASACTSRELPHSVFASKASTRPTPAPTCTPYHTTVNTLLLLPLAGDIDMMICLPPSLAGRDCGEFLTEVRGL